MFLGFLPWTLFESLRELGDWWAFCDELESFEKKQNKLNEKFTQPLKFDQSKDKKETSEKDPDADKSIFSSFFSVISDDSDLNDDDDEDIILSLKDYEIWMAMLINVGAVLSTRMMSIDYVHKQQVLKSLKYIITKDAFKSLFKGFVSTYIGTAILIQSLRFGY